MKTMGPTIQPLVSFSLKLNHSALDKKQGAKTQFFPKKYSRKRKMDFILPIIFTVTATDGLCYRVINSSILQELFSSVSKSQKIHHPIKKNH